VLRDQKMSTKFSEEIKQNYNFSQISSKTNTFIKVFKITQSIYFQKNLLETKKNHVVSTLQNKPSKHKSSIF